MNRGPQLAVGARGRDVLRVQTIFVMMKTLGFDQIDGVFGTRTRNAVVEFQEGEGLPADTDHNNLINMVDFGVWKENYGLTPQLLFFGPGSGNSVPEPASILLAASAVGTFLARRSRRICF